MTNKKRPTRPEEGRAAAIVAAATAGTLHPLDRPPLQNVADYFLQLPGRTAGVLEVTSHGDPDRANLHAQLRKQGRSHLNPRLSKFWSAYLPPMPLHQRGLPVKYADVLSKLPQIEQVLLSLERQERYATGAWEESVEADQLRHLGVSSVLGLNNGEPSINFLPPGDGGGSGPSAVVAAALSEASKPDNQRKLERDPYPERAGGRPRGCQPATAPVRLDAPDSDAAVLRLGGSRPADPATRAPRAAHRPVGGWGLSLRRGRLAQRRRCVARGPDRQAVPDRLA